jgi:hypothetical protein
MTRITASIFVLFSVARCGPTAARDTSPPSAATGSTGATASKPSIVGTWQNFSSATTMHQTLTFTSDGNVTQVEQYDDGSGTLQTADTLQGTYEVSGSVLTMSVASTSQTGAQSTQSRQAVYLDDEYLMLVVLKPSANHTGIVGTWTGTVQQDESTSMDVTIVINADGTLALTSTSGGSSETLNATYSADTATGIYDAAISGTSSTPNLKLILAGDNLSTGDYTYSRK